MPTPVVASQIGPEHVVDVRELIARAESVLGYRPVSDQFWADLTHGSTGPFVTASIAPPAATGGAAGIVAYAQATGSADGRWTVETVVAPSLTADAAAATDALTALLDSIIDAIRAQRGRSLTWVVQGPTDLHTGVAASRGFALARELHQMRRPLPTGMSVQLETRPFDPSRDIDEWVRVNARAFAWNPEQGSWTAANVLARMDEPWFDADGFLVHEREGRMAGFCWTKVHDTTPPLGEIYVIAVDPDFHGQGLGRDLTLAGLASLAARGITTGMLFVDADNAAAVGLYTKLGFTIHRTDALFEKELT